MTRKTKEIKVVLHLPDDTQALRLFEKRLCDFYTAQVEKRLQPLRKGEKLEVLQAIIDNFNT